jgi:hypothetical protein
MKKVYLFNPENDMALACGDVYYQPTAIVRRMACELSALPAWYALAGSAVRMTAPSAEAWQQFVDESPVKPLATERVEALGPGDVLCPWGWSPALVHQWGLTKEVEPIRRLSSRRTAVEVLAELGGGESRWLTSMDEVDAYIYNKVCVLKAPWSGSGRGVYFVSTDGLTDSQRGWAERILRTQGALVGEPRYRGVQDFAMEFSVDEVGEVRFAGYSLFETDRQGAYKGNLLASDEAIEAKLADYVGREALLDVRTRLTDVLRTKLGGAYTGPLGVDMMIHQTAEGYALHPCIEINLRMNMGLVARRFYDQYVSGGATGRYVVDFSPKQGEVRCRHQRMQAEYPCQVSGNRLLKGYLSLTPVTEETCYQAYVLIE